MAYLAPIHRPSSIRHAIKLNLLTPEEDCLVVAKANRLEIWRPHSDGVRLFHTLPINGRIVMLDAIRPASSRCAHLFIGTERFQYFTLSWSEENSSLVTEQSFIDCTNEHMRESQSIDRVSVDPTGQYIAMEMFEGLLNVTRVTKPKRGTTNYLNSGDAPQQLRIEEYFIRSSAFLRTTAKVPRWAVLYTDKQERPRLRIYSLTDKEGRHLVESFDKSNRHLDIDLQDPGAALLVPVPESPASSKRYIGRDAKSAGRTARLGGVIVVGETTMLYVDDESEAEVEYTYDEPTIYVAWAQYDETRFFVADDYGNLKMLQLKLSGEDVVDMHIEFLASISKPSKLVYLGDGLLFVASHEGDSQVLRAAPDERNYEVVQTLSNIAPILDFTVMDMGSRDTEGLANEYSSGQARIVTGSGSFQTGSLRSVRSGVGLEDLGILGEMANVRAMFSLKGSAPFGFVDTLLVAFMTETRVMVFDDDGSAEEKEEHLGLRLNEPTLVARNVLESRILQVTPSGVSLTEVDSGMSTSSWSPPASTGITAAAANDKHVLLSMEGRNLICLKIADGLKEIARVDLGDSGDQVACVCVPEVNENIVVVGFWQGSVSILGVETLQVIHAEALRDTTDSAAVPRDLALASLLPEQLNLFISMSDGTVRTFDVHQDDYSLSGRKSIVLGVQQPTFQIIPRKDGLVNIFATCEHASLIYGNEGRIVYSAVTAEDAKCVCPFDTEAFPDSIVMATKDDIRISRIDDERRTHVTTLKVKELVRRIAYSPTEKVFGLGTVKQTISGIEETVTSSFRLVDEVIFDDLGVPFILNDHPGTEIVEAVARATLRDSHGEPVERFLVGTSFLDEEMNINVRGRILVFGIDTNRSPRLIAQTKLKGACRSIIIHGEMIIAALVKTVAVFSYQETTSAHGNLEKQATFRTATCPIDLALTDDGLIVVADLQKSMSILEYQKGDKGERDRLVEVARDNKNCYATAISHIEGDNYLEADAEGNLLVLRRLRDGLTESERLKLKDVGYINIGEQVNRIRKISVEASKSATVVPRAFLATVEGSLYLYGQISTSSIQNLLNLQASLARVLPSPGNIPHGIYRGYRTAQRLTDEPYRFVDGEFVERFLELEEGMQEEVAGGVGLSGDYVRGLVEELKRLR